MRHAVFRSLPVPVRRRLKAIQLQRRAQHEPALAAALAQSMRGPLGTGRIRARRLGFDLDLDLADGASRILYYTGQIEAGLIDLARRELRAGDVVADIGAYVGVVALAFADILHSRGGGHVYAFEAAPDTCARLRSHVSVNRASDRITVVETALLDRAAEVALHAEEYFGSSDASVRSLYGDGASTGSVRAIRFDDWAADVGLERLDAVKLDVEGAERAVIAGMADTLTRLRPRLLVVEEKAYLLERAGVAPEAITDQLAELGYRRDGTVSELLHDGPVTEHDDDNVVYRPVD